MTNERPYYGSTFVAGQTGPHPDPREEMTPTITPHCKDCCCARSWESLGITEYTGKSIPEHIKEIRQSEREKARGLYETLRLVLPMAKGWAYQNNVGSNRKYVELAKQALTNYDSGG